MRIKIRFCILFRFLFTNHSETTLKIIPIEVSGPTEGISILTTTFALVPDESAVAVNPILITFSIDPTVHDPEQVIEALESLADRLSEGMEVVNLVTEGELSNEEGFDEFSAIISRDVA